MNCYFCNQPCVKRTRLAKGTGEDWYCNNHPKSVLHEVNYTYHKKGDCEGEGCCPKKHFDAISIRWGETSDTYCYDAEWKMADNRFNFYKLNYGLIFSLDKIPNNLTPENVEEKVTTWMPFL